MEKMYEVNEVGTKNHLLSLRVNGTLVECDLSRMSPVLANASTAAIARVVVDPVGIGFHWPELDEDLSIDGILRDLKITIDKNIPDFVTHTSEERSWQ